MSLESREPMEPSFEQYVNGGGSLSEDIYNTVLSASCTEDEYRLAMRAILPAGLPDHSFVEMAAKIIHVLGSDDPRVQNAFAWLIPETYIFLGRM